MPAAEGLAHFILAAGQPAVVQVPVLYGHSGDVVELVGLAGHEVGHHVAIIAPPLHAGIEGQHAALDLRLPAPAILRESASSRRRRR
ncbi:hypothetical protein G6F55_014316 [Rhizopus delemar]|nr:hypothetical protein G6F55_014316 [Rhizopus delemar]